MTLGLLHFLLGLGYGMIVTGFICNRIIASLHAQLREANWNAVEQHQLLRDEKLKSSALRRALAGGDADNSSTQRNIP